MQPGQLLNMKQVCMQAHQRHKTPAFCKVDRVYFYISCVSQRMLDPALEMMVLKATLYTIRSDNISSTAFNLIWFVHHIKQLNISTPNLGFVAILTNHFFGETELRYITNSFGCIIYQQRLVRILRNESLCNVHRRRAAVSEL